MLYSLGQTGFQRSNIARIKLKKDERMREILVLGDTVAVLLLIAAVSCASPARGAAEKRKIDPLRRVASCDENVLVANTVNSLLKRFGGGVLLHAEAFEGDEARLFLEAFGALFPALSIPRADAVATFSGDGISLLFFLDGGCPVHEHSLNLSAYEGIKARLHSRRKSP